MQTLIPVKPLDNITRVEYKGQPVLTTEQLAAALSTPDKVVTINNLQANFRNNRDRFIEGKHFFRLTGKELDELRNCMKNFQTVIPPRTAILYLWTKRGVARHCKSVGTDVAWDIYERLEDTYFAVEQLLRDKPLVSVADFERGVRLCKLASHARDPYTKKRLVAEAANLILGKDFLALPKAQITLF